MKVKELIEIYNNGVLNCSPNNLGGITAGGMELDRDKSLVLINRFGWVGFDTELMDVVNRTARYARALKSATGGCPALGNLELAFNNNRIQGTLDYRDRIRLYHQDGSCATVLIGQGSGKGRVTVYSDSNHNMLPLFSGGSVRKALEFVGDMCG